MVKVELYMSTSAKVFITNLIYMEHALMRINEFTKIYPKTKYWDVPRISEIAKDRLNYLRSIMINYEIEDFLKIYYNNNHNKI